jgi:ankyrin repeat protein
LATNRVGLSAVEIAAAARRPAVLELLLGKGASPAFTNPRDGRTPLHAAALYDRGEAADLLIRLGAKVDAFDACGLTPLHVAALRRSTNVAVVLLRNLANPRLFTVAPVQPGSAPSLRVGDGASLAGNTALHLAAASGHASVLQLLLDSGVPADLRNQAGKTALDLVSTSAADPPDLWLTRTVLRSWEPLARTEPLLPRSTQTLLADQKATASLLERRSSSRSSSK